MEGWMECLGRDVNRMVCGMGSGVDWVGVMVGGDVKSGWVVIGVKL